MAVAPAVHVWQVGKAAFQITISGGAINAAGVLTPTATQSMRTIWDEIDVDVEAETEEISSADAFIQHTVIIKDGWRVRCQNIARLVKHPNTGGGPSVNPLAALLVNFEYFFVVIAFRKPGGSTLDHCDIWQGWATRGRYSRQYRKGRSIEVLSFEPCDPGFGNPAYFPPL